MATTYVRIVPAAEDDFPGLYWIRKENAFLNTDRGGFWGQKSQANMFKSQGAATTYTQQKGWQILPKAPEGFTVIWDEGNAGKYNVIAEKSGELDHWLNLQMTGWTTNPLYAVRLPWNVAKSISDTYK